MFRGPSHCSIRQRRRLRISRTAQYCTHIRCFVLFWASTKVQWVTVAAGTRMPEVTMRTERTMGVRRAFRVRAWSSYEMGSVGNAYRQGPGTCREREERTLSMRNAGTCCLCECDICHLVPAVAEAGTLIARFL